MQILDLSPVVPVQSIEDVLTERERQIIAFNHTPEQDALLPVGHLPKQARAFLEGAIDEIMFQREGWQQRARRKLAKAGAITLASIDRLSAEGGA
jgi:hypothetical protein